MAAAPIMKLVHGGLCMKHIWENSIYTMPGLLTLGNCVVYFELLSYFKGIAWLN